ncbi:CS domain-containing protein [Capsaspora owczarzaki ATCC 30864]|uniref:CS domain-containing protein n=1 Tax=Capsaspora owczarzaki (strain ATCC 30864) TaxID=595528 RepID=A0A0D2U3E2_CAPO3|nr:CS domain-containing protein [Capsaspora owczarzaki ATCC 30864]KJE89716.1 CS domain-containing protein [Capsaspora owczarzaki ATCC 30864]|eukprot:XP_004366018.1 CS domain-containing protein [Capsaspora owczarzaki ATCC 30864]
MTTLLPTVQWAQRRDKILLRVSIADATKDAVTIEPTKVSIDTVAGSPSKHYKVAIELYGEIDPAQSRFHVGGHEITIFLIRKEEGPYWPRLLKTAGKAHYLKVDFDKWKDEDEADENDDMGMGDMGGMGGMGGMDMSSLMSGMGGMGGMGGMDMSSLMSGMGGMGGMGGGMPDFGDDEGDDEGEGDEAPADSAEQVE